MTPSTLIVDGKTVEFRDGETILSAAHRAEIDIPTLCYSPGLAPEGGCRVCLVKSGADGRYVAACHTPALPGMKISTTAPELDELRRDILSLTLARHAPESFAASQNGSPLERLMNRLGIDAPTFGWRGRPADADGAIDASHPYLRFDSSICITCRRCLHACEEIQGQFVYGVSGRGGRTSLIFGPTERFADSPCTSCGACVEQCPTGAISDRDRIDHRAAEQTTDSTCGYCGVGCQVRIESAEGRVLRIGAVPGAEANRGHLCAKGRYAHAYHHHADRLTKPLRREGDRFVEIGWNEALDWAASRMIQIRDQHGSDALAAITSSRSTNEAAYLCQKLFRTAIGTNNVDCCARVCHSSTALALKLVTGTSAATASYEDIEKARFIVVAGANPTEAHPVVGARIKEAVLRGAGLIVIDPRSIELAEYADLHLQLVPGTNVPLFNAIGKLLVEENRIDLAYVEQRCEGLAEFREFAAKLSLAEASKITGVAIDSIARAAAMIGSGPVLFVHGLGLSELTQGTASVMTLCNLGMLTGSIGRPGAGMLPLRGQNNVQGNADMGAAPDAVTGYQSIADPAVRAHFKNLWGRPLPERPGFTISEMFQAAVNGKLRALWIQGEDVAQSESNQSFVIEALHKLDLLVVQDLFMCETARHAHLILPAASVLENEGTFTNGERRIQLVRPAVPPPGEARPDWTVFRDLAPRLGLAWNYTSPAEVIDEIAKAAAKLFGGVSYARLGKNGLQWPCPDRGHPGTRIVHADSFLRGKGQLVAIDYAPSPETTRDGYPYLLITGRVLQHYNVGTMTFRTPNRALTPTDVLEIHPDDARRDGIEEMQEVRIESRWGRTKAPARLSERVAPGTLFLSFHDPETHANLLVGPHVDPLSKCPDYKVTAVRLSGCGS